MTDKTEQTDPRVIELAARLEARGCWVSLDGRISEATAAEHLLGCTPRTLQRWREEGLAPPFIVIGRKPTYRLRDLIQWIDGRRHDPRAA